MKAADFLGRAQLYLCDEGPFARLSRMQMDLRPRSTADKHIHGNIVVSLSFGSDATKPVSSSSSTSSSSTPTTFPTSSSST